MVAASSKARKFDQRVRLMCEVVQMDGGRAVPMPVEIAKLWCSIRPLAGRELVQIRQVLPEATHIVETWFRRDITAENWLEHDGRRLAIAEPPRNLNERRRYLQMFCVEQTGGG